MAYDYPHSRILFSTTGTIDGNMKYVMMNWVGCEARSQPASKYIGLLCYNRRKRTARLSGICLLRVNEARVYLSGALRELETMASTWEFGKDQLDRY